MEEDRTLEGEEEKEVAHNKANPSTTTANPRRLGVNACNLLQVF
jgi:hypothetical protein